MHDWIESALGALGVGGLLAWWAKREISRIDALAKEKADRESIKEFVEDFKRHGEQTRKDFGRVHEKLDITISSIGEAKERISRIEGKLENNPTR